jgi:endonuclease III
MSRDDSSHQQLYEVLKVCASLPEVKVEVMKNHDDNQWWPVTLSDWRLRLVIAGWSTRVSYRMIATYRRVVMSADALGYDQLCAMQDEDIEKLVESLGLARTRVAYFRSVQHFLERTSISKSILDETENDALIDLFAQQVKGAGYKVAQCAILYAKGYHCGIFPVDSGMKDMLGPCLGLKLPKGPHAHEVMRKQTEHLLKEHAGDYYDLALSLGYGHLSLPQDRAPVWWAHLALIYFKRRYCNAHHPEACPLRNNQLLAHTLGTMCDRFHPQQGRWLNVHNIQSAQ